MRYGGGVARRLLFLGLLGCTPVNSAADVPDEAPLTPSLGAEAVARCLRFPDALRFVDTPDPASTRLWGRTAAAHAQSFELLIYRGPSQLTQDLEAASRREGRPSLAANAHTDALAGDAQRSVAELMLGNSLVWATTSSPHGTFSLTLYFKVPLRESVHDVEGERAFAAVTDLTKTSAEGGHLEQSLDCLRDRLWPKTGPR